MGKERSARSARRRVSMEVPGAGGGAGWGACAGKGVSSKELLSRLGVRLGQGRRAAGVGTEVEKGEGRGVRADGDGGKGTSDLEPGANGRQGSRSRRRRNRSGKRWRAHQARGIGTGDQAARITQLVYTRWEQGARGGRGEVRGERSESRRGGWEDLVWVGCPADPSPNSGADAGVCLSPRRG